MVILVNGRGQLGEKLKRLTSLNTKKSICIYHTWTVTHNVNNAEDETIQRGEYEKFIRYVDLNLDKRIIFISSTSNRNSFYAKYKELAEAYLLTHHSDGIVLKFPAFIGKGLLPKLKSGEYMAFGTLELITLDNVVNIIEKYINDNDYQKRIYHIAGEKIEALTVLEILKI